jgi:hypothetical protein
MTDNASARMWQQFDLASPDVRREWLAALCSPAFARPRSLTAVTGRGRLADLRRAWGELDAVDRRRWFAEFLSAVPDLCEIGAAVLAGDRGEEHGS